MTSQLPPVSVGSLVGGPSPRRRSVRSSLLRASSPLLTIAALMALAGCASSATQATTDADTTAPAVTTTEPASSTGTTTVAAPEAPAAPAAPTAPTEPAKPAVAAKPATPPAPPVPEAPRDPFTTLGYRQAWASFSATPPGRVVQTVDFLDDQSVVVTDTGGVASGLSSGGGKLLWASNLDTPSTRFLGAFDDGPRVGIVADRRVYFVDRQQQTIVSVQQMERAGSAKPIRYGTVLLMGTGSGFSFAHNITTGFQSWAYAVGGPINFAPVQVGSDGVAFASDSGNVLIVDATTGRSLGRAGLYSGPAAPLTAAPDAVFIASRDRSLYAIERAGGGERWRVRSEGPLDLAPIYHAGVVYCWFPARGLLAFDANNGAVKWAAPEVRGTVVGMRGNRLVVWNPPEAILLDAAKGEVVARVTIDDAKMLLTDKFVDGSLFTVSASGRVAKYQPR